MLLVLLRKMNLYMVMHLDAQKFSELIKMTLEEQNWHG